MEVAKARIEGDGGSVQVHINPATLTLRFVNRLEAEKHAGNRMRQHLGAASATLSFEAIFNTAQTGADVRAETKRLSKMLFPQSPSRPAPSRVTFVWGQIAFKGVVEQIVETVEFFSPAGVPLRSRVFMIIKEQSFEHSL